jgi:hypothetical protein
MYSGTWLAEQTGVKAPVERVVVSEKTLVEEIVGTEM